jgi:Uma2 family endonuclease
MNPEKTTCIHQVASCSLNYRGGSPGRGIRATDQRSARGLDIVAPEAKVLRYRDLAALPDDGRRWELWDGVLHEVTVSGTRHQRIVGNLLVVMDAHVRRRGLGEVLVGPLDVILADITVFQPDVIFVASNRASAVAERGIEGAPTLAIEILSPSTAVGDRGLKRDLYARYGVPYYWIVDGDAQMIETYVLAGESYRLAARAGGTAAVDLPPFTSLGLVPATLFPPLT